MASPRTDSELQQQSNATDAGSAVSEMFTRAVGAGGDSHSSSAPDTRSASVSTSESNSKSKTKIMGKSKKQSEEDDKREFEEYLRQNNAVYWMPMLRHFPGLVILAKDDPVTVIDNLYEEGEPFELYKGKNYADYFCSIDNISLVVTPTGSHCPFLDGGNFNFMEKVGGCWMLKNWAENAAVEFLVKVVLEEGKTALTHNGLYD